MSLATRSNTRPERAMKPLKRVAVGIRPGIFPAAIVMSAGVIPS